MNRRTSEYVMNEVEDISKSILRVIETNKVEFAEKFNGEYPDNFSCYLEDTLKKVCDELFQLYKRISELNRIKMELCLQNGKNCPKCTGAVNKDD